MARATVTLASVDQKLESFMVLVVQHMADDTKRFDRIIEALDGNGKPGLKTRVELAEKELEEVHASRKRSLTAIWTTFATVAAALILAFLGVGK